MTDDITPMSDSAIKVAMRVRERIESFPCTHDQSKWYCSPFGGSMSEAVSNGAVSALVVDAAAMSDCGVTACLAGHAILAATELGIPVPVPDSRYTPVPEAARRLLDMPREDCPPLFVTPMTTKALLRALDEAVEHGAWPARP